MYKLFSTPTVVPILYIQSSDRCNNTPGTLRGSTGDLLSTNGIGTRTLSPTSLNLIFLFVCLMIFSICFSCPLLAATLPFWILPSLLSNQQEKHHTGQPYPSLSSADGPQIACIGFLQPGHM